MASMVAKACNSNSSQLSGISVQEKGSRNKRKFRADPPVSDASKTVSVPLSDCSSYEFSAEKLDIMQNHGHSGGCDMCNVSDGHSDALKLDLGLSCAVGPFEAGTSKGKEENVANDEVHDADWSDLTESQLEELVLNNLDTIFKSAIKKLVDCGYTEEFATRAVLRSGLCYGCKDTVSNIVENTLAFLRNGQELEPAREQDFDDLQQMEKYILAELVCVIREVKPFFSTGDAMWCLLVCDMNVSLACAMESDSFGSFLGDGVPNGTATAPVQPQARTEARSSENLLNSGRQNPSFACACHFPSETSIMATVPCLHSSPEVPTMTVRSNLKPRNSSVQNGLVAEKETTGSIEKSFTAVGPTHSSVSEEKFIGSRKISGITKREYILRHKSIQLEKSYRTYGSKGGSRAGKLSSFGGLILDKKIKSVADSTGISVRNATFKISKETGTCLPPDTLHNDLLNTNGLPPAFSLDTVNNTISSIPKTNFVSAIPAIGDQTSLPAPDTELSLSLSSKNNSVPMPASCSSGAPNFGYAGSPYEKSAGQWVPQDKKDESIMKLAPRVRELQNQMQEWTEWANQKVMQAARRLSKDKAELKTLKQEKEEVERLKKEKQTLEENTMKKLCEMENALCKASGQVERANAAVRRLEVENSTLRKEMEAAKLQAAQSAASCQEVSKREKNTLMKIQSWEKQKIMFQEELVAEKQRKAQLQQKLEQATELLDHQEARCKREEIAIEELLTQAMSLKKDREQSEASAKSKENIIRLKAEKKLQKFKDDIEKHEKEISQLRSKMDSSKIAALRKGIDGSYASRLTDSRTPTTKESTKSYSSRMVNNFEDHSGAGGVKRERECVMCLSEEMSVVFLPCAHQVVCTSCNELHEKQGMKECPSCRSTIIKRIPVHFSRS